MKINSIASSIYNDVPIKESKASVDFGGFLKDAINKVNELEQQSQQADNQLVMGEIENIHEVMIAAQKADIAIQFTMEIKNKILDAYREIMRLQV